MQALNLFIVRLPKKFKDTVEVAGQELYLASKFNEFENRYNYGEIVSTPAKFNTGASVGDTLYFHHHICVESKYHLQEDLYMVQYEPDGGYGSHAYAFQPPSGSVVMLSDWVFVRPPEKEDEQKTTSGIILLEQESKVEDHGEIIYSSDAIEEAGAKAGDTVYFSKSSDYAMEVNGEKVWRMRINDLLYVDHGKKE